MKEYIINSNEAGQRFDKYLKKLLPNASSGFIFKMLRKKNITIDGKKATGTEIIKEGQSIKLFFSDETFDKFSVDVESLKNDFEYLKSLKLNGIKIIYEDEDIIVADKPVNMLSQKATDKDISANERLLGYLIYNGKLSFEDYKTFKPSVCNRLDRNTTGIILMGKSLKGLQELSLMLKDRTVKKYYRAIVNGVIKESSHLSGYLTKDSVQNLVSISDKPINEESAEIETEYKPISSNGKLTLLEVHLITGRSHQIRAHLASINHPIIGDIKYGNKKTNDLYQKNCNVRNQLLHAYKIVFPDGREFISEEPTVFQKILAN